MRRGLSHASFILSRLLAGFIDMDLELIEIYASIETIKYIETIPGRIGRQIEYRTDRTGGQGGLSASLG